MRTARVLGSKVTSHLNPDGVLHDLPGPSSGLPLAQECSALLHLGQKQQAVFVYGSKRGTAATASSYMTAATSEAPAARTTAKSDREVLGTASWS